MRNQYAERLMDFRKRFDLYPWCEVLQTTIAANSPQGTSQPFSFSLPYTLLAREFCVVAFQHGVSGGLDYCLAFPISIIWNTKEQDSAGMAFDSIGAVGDPRIGWTGLGIGELINRQQVYKFIVQTLANVPNLTGNGLMIYIGMRGYRFYEKGTIAPKQKTKAEHRDAGMGFYSFRYGSGLTFPSSVSASNATDDLIFDSDFLVESIETSVPNVGLYSADQYSGSDEPFGQAVHRQSLVSIEPSRAIYGARGASGTMVPVQTTNRYMLGGGNRWNGWKLEIPITVAKQDQWTFRAGVIATPQVSITQPINIVLHGSKLVPEGKAIEPALRKRQAAEAAKKKAS